MKDDRNNAHSRATHVTRRLIRLPEVRHITAMSRSQIYALISQRKFPAGVKLSKRIRAWPLSDIENWIEGRPSAGQDT